MSFRTCLEQSKLLYKSYVLFQAPAHILVLGQKLYFQLKNHVLLHTVFSNTFCGSVELSVLRNHQVHRALFYMKHTDNVTSPKHSLLVFQVKTNKVQDQVLLGTLWYNFSTCNFPAAVVQ